MNVDTIIERAALRSRETGDPSPWLFYYEAGFVRVAQIGPLDAEREGRLLEVLGKRPARPGLRLVERA